MNLKKNWVIWFLMLHQNSVNLKITDINLQILQFKISNLLIMFWFFDLSFFSTNFYFIHRNLDLKIWKIMHIKLFIDSFFCNLKVEIRNFVLILLLGLLLFFISIFGYQFIIFMNMLFSCKRTLGCFSVSFKRWHVNSFHRLPKFLKGLIITKITWKTIVSWTWSVQIIT